MKDAESAEGSELNARFADRKRANSTLSSIVPSTHAKDVIVPLECCRVSMDRAQSLPSMYKETNPDVPVCAGCVEPNSPPDGAVVFAGCPNSPPPACCCCGCCWLVFVFPFPKRPPPPAPVPNSPPPAPPVCAPVFVDPNSPLPVPAIVFCCAEFPKSEPPVAGAAAFWVAPNALPPPNRPPCCCCC